MTTTAQPSDAPPAPIEPRTFLDGKVVLYGGDCILTMAALEENSVDSIVCDPPYHLTSIVKRFGADGAAEAKPGATGAYQRASTGFMGRVWDGGDIAFQSETWAEALRVLKPGGYIVAFASTRGFGRMSVAMEDAGFITHPMLAWLFGTGFPKATRIKAEGYDGFRYGGQALKPALEPIYMGQKPFSEKTGTANVLRWGTGAINIDGCRVEGTPEPTRFDPSKHSHDGYRMNETGAECAVRAAGAGRWPANIVHDGSDEVVSCFPDSNGQQGDIRGHKSNRQSPNGVFGPTLTPAADHAARNDSGSAARFFYSAKADANDRIGSKHPTVKPVDLMQWLCRLVTPPGGTVLDPFAGSGSTGEAAWREGFNAILCEREEEYQADIAARLELADKGPMTRRSRIASRKRVVANDNDLFGAVEASSGGGGIR